jgi:hypothetical protein
MIRFMQFQSQYGAAAQQLLHVQVLLQHSVLEYFIKFDPRL